MIYPESYLVHVLNISLEGELPTLWQNFPAQVGFEHSHILGARRPSFIPRQIIPYTNFIGISIVSRILLKIYLIGIVKSVIPHPAQQLKRDDPINLWSIQKEFLPKWYFKKTSV